MAKSALRQTGPSQSTCKDLIRCSSPEGTLQNVALEFIRRAASLPPVTSHLLHATWYTLSFICHLLHATCRIPHFPVSPLPENDHTAVPFLAALAVLTVRAYGFIVSVGCRYISGSPLFACPGRTDARAPTHSTESRQQPLSAYIDRRGNRAGIRPRGRGRGH